FVWGAREAESVSTPRVAGRARSRKPRTRAATRWSLTLPRPLTLAGVGWHRAVSFQNFPTGASPRKEVTGGGDASLVLV
ncbi:MAG TPA: hypothetical protein VF550_17260, partial [Polyangia bacterium]